jgi:hypothetical protein
LTSIRHPEEASRRSGSQRLVATIAIFSPEVRENARPDCARQSRDPPAVDFPVYPSAATRGKYLEAVLSAVGW